MPVWRIYITVACQMECVLILLIYLMCLERGEGQTLEGELSVYHI